MQCTAKHTCGRSLITDERAWFPTSCLPSGWAAVALSGSAQSCCPPSNQESPDEEGNNGGCSYVDGGACTVLEFTGTVPATAEEILAWKEALLVQLADALANYGLCTKQIALTLITISDPTANEGTTTFSVRLTLHPPAIGGVTCDEIMAALSSCLSRGSLTGSVAQDIVGVASYRSYGKLEASTLVDTSKSGAAASFGGISLLSLASLIVAAMAGRAVVLRVA